jgi:aquaporin Z|tara:strand:- start:215 stop:478 length:264 start_codon:yes stop_codon:yes gene_type:complete
MLAYLVEFIGTFLFLSVILSNGKNPIAIAVALLSVIYFGGAISGGHFNPAVSVMMYLSKSIKLDKLLGYVVVQVLGGASALYFSKLK